MDFKEPITINGTPVASTTNPYLPVISSSVHMNGVDQTGLSTGSAWNENKVLFTTAEWNTNSSFDLTSSKFQPKVAGLYSIHARAQANTTVASGTQWYIILKKNGVEIKQGDLLVSGGTAWPASTLSCSVELNGSTDYLELSIIKSTTGDYGISGSKTATFFQAELVSVAQPFVPSSVVTPTVSFSAHKGGIAQTALAYDVYTKLTFTNEVYDINANYDAVNSKFVPSIAGKYHITASLWLSPVVANSAIRIMIYKNGQEYIGVTNRTPYTSGGAYVACDIDMNGTTDYLEVYAVHWSSGSSATIAGAAAETFFQGHLISATTTQTPSGQSTLVKQVVLSSVQSSITLDGLSGLADGGYILELALVGNVDSTSIGLGINGDLAQANYVGENLYGHATSAYANTPNNTNHVAFGSSGYLSTASIDIQLASGKVQAISTVRGRVGGGERTAVVGVRYNTTVTDITSIVLQGYTDGTTNTLANCFGVGTVVRLYRKIVNGAAHSIKSNGTLMPAQGYLNFGPGFALTDDSAVGVTKIDISNKLQNLVQEIVVAESNTNQVTFNGLNGDSDGGYILECEFLNANAGPASLYMYINGDTTDSNYRYQEYYCENGNTAAGGTNAIPKIAGALGASNSLSRVLLSQVGGYPQALAEVSAAWTSSNMRISMIAWQYNISANITSLTLNCPAGSYIAINSKFRLYRRKSIQPVEINPSYLSNLVKEVVVTSATNQIEFTNLDLINDGGYILDYVTKETTVPDDIVLFANTDTTKANYTSFVTGIAITAAAINRTDPRPSVFWASALGGQGSIQIDLTKSFTAKASNNNQVTATTTEATTRNVIHNGSMANVTKLTLASNSGSLCLTPGSVFRLYKRKTNPALVVTHRYLGNLVEEKRITADTSSVTFSNLDSSVDGDYHLDISGIGTGYSGAINCYVNDITTDAQYLQQYHEASGGTNTSQGTNTMPIVGFSQGYEYFSTNRISIVNGVVAYAGKLTRRVDANMTMYVSESGVYCKTTGISCINKLTISCASSAGIRAGSVIRLFKSNGARLSSALRAKFDGANVKLINPGVGIEPYVNVVLGDNGAWEEIVVAKGQKSPWYVPSAEYRGGRLELRVKWTSAVTTGNVTWKLQLAAVLAGMSMDCALQTARSVTTASSAYVNESVLVFTPTAAEIAAQCGLKVVLERDSADTLTGNVSIISVELTEL